MKNQILVVEHVYNESVAFRIKASYDLTGVIPPGDSFQARLPDFSGHVWFVTQGGIVGTLDMAANDGQGRVQTTRIPRGEAIENALAADEDGGVYFDSTQALYRCDADQDGAPSLTWREPYDGGTHVKDVSRGSGSTPTLMGTDYVAIADNADPQMHVLVYRRAKDVQGPRLVCAEPVFMPGQSTTENSFVATDRSIVVDNNFGYRDVKSAQNGKTSKPGLTRVDIDDDGNGCHTEWANMEVVVAAIATKKMSLDNGLIYAYTKPKGPANTDAWYFTAIDFHTGEEVYSVLAGTGTYYSDHGAVLYLGDEGTVYQGVLGGIVSLQDGK